MFLWIYQIRLANTTLNVNFEHINFEQNVKHLTLETVRVTNLVVLEISFVCVIFFSTVNSNASCFFGGLDSSEDFFFIVSLFCFFI